MEDTITPSQIEELAEKVSKATRKAGLRAIKLLVKEGTLTPKNFHRVLAKAGRTGGVVRPHLHMSLENIASDTRYLHLISRVEKIVLRSTPEIEVLVYEQFDEASFGQLFASFGVSFDQLCLTEEQIQIFDRDYFEWVRDNMWFLTQVEGEFRLAYIRRGILGNKIRYLKFDEKDATPTDYLCCLVVPKLY